MLLYSLLALSVLAVPAGTAPPRAIFDSVVPRLPGGYGPGRVSIRVHVAPVPEPASAALVGELVARTGVAITETQGVRIRLVLPDDVEFASMQARVVDGLVLRPKERSFVGRVGAVLVSLLRILFIGKLVSATDELSIPGVAWASALGAPDAQDELVRLTTSETLTVDRADAAFSDHGAFVVCRAMLALSPWTELVDVQLRCIDRVSGRPVAFIIPRLPLHGGDATEEAPDAGSRWALAVDE